MILLFIIAACVIAVAVIATVLLVRPTPELRAVPKLRTTDQRGYTLQTLIVTAVVVVVAVVVGVTLFAISGGSGEDLEESSSDLESLCSPWEIFDIELEAAGHGGVSANGGIKSSAIGCYQFCYIESNEVYGQIWPNSRSVPSEPVIETPGTAARPGFGYGTMANFWWLRHSHDRSQQTTRRSHNANWLREVPGASYTILRVVGPRHVDIDTQSFLPNRPMQKQQVPLVQYPADGGTSEKYEIRIAPNKQYCYVWNSDTEEEVFRSTEVGYTPPPGHNEFVCRPQLRENSQNIAGCVVGDLQSNGSISWRQS